jgi:hypothetical protein
MREPAEDLGERGKQRTKRHPGDLHQLRTSLQQIRYRTLRAPTSGGQVQADLAELYGPDGLK